MKFLPQSLTQKVGRQVLLAKKNSPKALFVVGIGGVVVSTVLACRATLKLEKTLEEFKDEVDLIKENEGKEDATQQRKTLVYVYTKNSVKLARLYAPAIIVGGASIAALTTSHVTLSRRNSNLTAAYTALSMAYDSYRDRTRDEVGTEKELDIYHAATDHKVTVGSKTETLKVVDPNQYSVYAKMFDEANPNWQKSPELNRNFIQCRQNYLNHVLQSRGHVFLNEAYEGLGFEHTQAGAVCGWVISETGDNFIDFGIFEACNANFVNNWERSMVLDFNVDGLIWDKI